MEQGFLGGDPLGRVVDEHLFQEIQASGLNLLHAAGQSHGLPVGEGGFEVGQLGDSRPEVLGGSPQNTEDPEELVDLGVSLEHNNLISISS